MSEPTLVIIAHANGAFVGKLLRETEQEIALTGLCHLESDEKAAWYLMPAAVPVGLVNEGLVDAVTVFQRRNTPSMSFIPDKGNSPLWDMFKRKWGPALDLEEDSVTTESAE